MPTRTALPLARCGAFALCAAVLAVGGHAAGGGHRPAAVAVGAAVLACAVAGWLVARAPHRPALVLGALAALQYGLHRLFEAWPHPAGPAPMAGMPMAGMPMDAAAHAHLVAAAPAEPSAPGWMLAGHAVSMLLTGSLLAWGDRTLAALLRALRATPAFRLPAALPRLVAPRLPAPHRPAPRPTCPDAVADLRRRGPPTSVPAL